MGHITVRRRLQHLRRGAPGIDRHDTLAVEEPLEIRIGGQPLAVTMRTPGADMDLAAGFLVAEGIVACAEEIGAIRYCTGTPPNGTNTYNVLDCLLAAGVPDPSPSLRRAFTTTSSCGVCGKASIETVRTRSPHDLRTDVTAVPPDVVTSLPERLRAAQRVFDSTGGLHAAGLFDPTGALLCIREDVGRHNAVDKVVGWALRNGRLPLRGGVLLVSGRASFELVQKAWMAGIPVLAAVSAPSSLAAELADEAGMTLIGFLRGDTMNVYAGADRLAPRP